MTWAILWLAFTILFAVVEAWAVVNDRPGDTFTENTRPWIRRHPVLTALAWLGWAWLGYHFLIDI